MRHRPIAALALEALALAALAPLTSRSPGLQAQEVIVVTGRVTSQFGSPIAGANVFVAAPPATATTDAEGRYWLSIPASRLATPTVVLRARALGYQPESRATTTGSTAIVEDFVLRGDVNRLEDVVVTGTVTPTSQKKLAYAVTRLDAADMPVPAASALLQLQGKVPGALIVQPSGRPGTSPAIVLRGPKSLAAGGRQQGPLIIVDGTILNTNAHDLDPQDIESIEVIKGAAASSLYGSRAAAGVVQIMTRSGKGESQDARFTLRSEVGLSGTQGEYAFARRHFLMMDERNERFCIRETGRPACSRTVDFEEETARINNNLASASLSPRAFERDYGLISPSMAELKGLFQVNHWPRAYNPVAQALTNGAFRNTNVSMSAHPGSTGYFVSLSDFAQEGAVRFLRGYRRNTLRANLDQDWGDRWNIALRSQYGRGTQFPATAGSVVNVATDDFFRLTRVPAGANLLRYDTYGRLFIRSNPLAGGEEKANPLYAFANSEGRLDNDRLIASLAITHTPTQWLTLDVVGSTDRLRASEFIFRDREYRTTRPFGSNNGGTQGYVHRGNSEDLSQNLMLSARARSSWASNWQGALTTRLSVEAEDITSSSGEGTELAVSGPKTLSLARASTVFIQSSTAAIRALGALAGGQVEYRERYIADALLRYDGSSLFGANERWHPYYRASFAWRMSDEPRWPFARLADDVKLRGSVGTAGGRPRFDAQYESFRVSAGGQVNALNTLGNPDLKPEHTIETEYGLDAQVLGRYGLVLTYARDITTDQLLRVPAPVASGYPNQWRNAGTLDSKTWELSLRVPLITTRSLVWTSQLGWDRSRTFITALDRPPFFEDIGYFGAAQSGVRFFYSPGERYGTIHGHKFITSCAELPSPFDSQCGTGQEWQINDEGYVVWVGQGRSWQDGVTSNLWQSVRPGCLKDGVALSAGGADECVLRGGTVNTPWGLPGIHWGMPTVLRDSSGKPAFVPIGNTMPDYRLTMAHSIQWRRLAIYGLLDVSRGNRMVNLERQWSLLELMVREVDQDGKTPETAKPIGYYWRAAPPEGAGTGGFYDSQLSGSNRTIEDASYTKLREVSVTYELRRLPLIAGEWSVSFVGRNLYTWTKYTGWDPEMGLNGGTPNSAALVTGGMYQYPPTRSFTLAVLARF